MEADDESCVDAVDDAHYYCADGVIGCGRHRGAAVDQSDAHVQRHFDAAENFKRAHTPKMQIAIILLTILLGHIKAIHLQTEVEQKQVKCFSK